MADWSQITADWLNNAINGVVTIVDAKYGARAAKESAALQASINESTAQTAAQQASNNNMVRNVLLVVGGTLGLILVYGVAKKALR